MFTAASSLGTACLGEFVEIETGRNFKSSIRCPADAILSTANALTLQSSVRPSIFLQSVSQPGRRMCDFSCEFLIKWAESV
jgi:hypothetical protein